MAVLSLASCDSGCLNRELQRARSPDGRRDAVVFIRGCGATTRPVVNVSLVPFGDELSDDAGRVLVIDEPAAMMEEAGDISPAWISPDTLIITLSPRRTSVLRRGEIQGVTVIYEER